MVNLTLRHESNIVAPLLLYLLSIIRYSVKHSCAEGTEDRRVRGTLTTTPESIMRGRGGCQMSQIGPCKLALISPFRLHFSRSPSAGREENLAKQLANPIASTNVNTQQKYLPVVLSSVRELCRRSVS